MKILGFILAVLMPIFALGGCGGDVKVNYGDSELYSKAEIDRAVDTVMDEFDTWDGCEMFVITYAGDKLAESELDYCNSLAKEGQVFTECIVFKSTFRSPVLGGGAWEPNAIYENWSWYLARESGGRWQLLTWGYG